MSNTQVIFLMSVIMLHAGLCAPTEKAQGFGGVTGIGLVALGTLIAVLS